MSTDSTKSPDYEERRLSSVDVAKMLGISRDAVIQRYKRGELEGEDVAGDGSKRCAPRFSKADVDRHLDGWWKTQGLNPPVRLCCPRCKAQLTLTASTEAH